MLTLLLTGCLTNPATGRPQLNLIGSSTEIRLGQQLDEETTATMPLLEDEALGAYVSEVGRKMAATSERPDLPWTVRLLDDATVNAFALPGGYLYVTRGLLTWLGSEDELAAVLGHEIGHVTARHSANSLSRTLLSLPLIGLVGVLDPQMEHIGLLTGVGAGLARLSHSREDERQADDLGLRYVQRAGYDPSAMIDVFTVLETVSGEEGDRLPTWLLTHPTPGDRKARLGSIAAVGERKVSAYLDRVDGLIFGDDPRQGYFDGDRFHHPELAFRLDFPEGWSHANQHTAVQSASPEGTATFEVTIAEEETAEAAVAAFLDEEGMSARTWDGAGQAFRYTVTGSDGAVRAVDGAVHAVEHGDAVYRLVGLATLEAWPDVRGPIATVMASFAEETDPAVLSRQPERLRIGELGEGLSLAEFAQRHPAADSKTLADLNRVTDEVPAGLVRWVE